MKKKIILVYILIFLLTIFNFNFIFASSEIPEIRSESAILIDTNTNEILYKKNENKRMYPASTTKILTAILTLENCNLDDLVTVSYSAIFNIPPGYSIADLKHGEVLTVEQLLQLLLVHSANDAANVLAEYVGGSIESFVSIMNTKLHDLGLENTHFTNPYGLHDENHYTTAYDLALLMEYCLQNSDFRKLAGEASCSIPVTNLSDVRSYANTNEMLNPDSEFYYPYMTTGKTGFTTPAGKCLVSSAYKNDIELICVVLNDNNDEIPYRFLDTKDLYEYVFNNYSLKTVVKQDSPIYQITVKNATKETQYLNLLAKNEIKVLLNNNESSNNFEPNITLVNDISAPIVEGTVLGKAQYTINGFNYSVDLIASHSVAKSELTNYLYYGLSILLLIIIIGGIVYLEVTKTNRKA